MCENLAHLSGHYKIRSVAHRGRWRRSPALVSLSRKAKQSLSWSMSVEGSIELVFNTVVEYIERMVNSVRSLAGPSANGIVRRAQIRAAAYELAAESGLRAITIRREPRRVRQRRRGAPFRRRRTSDSNRVKLQPECLAHHLTRAPYARFSCAPYEHWSNHHGPT